MLLPYEFLSHIFTKRKIFDLFCYRRLHSNAQTLPHKQLRKHTQLQIQEIFRHLRNRWKDFEFSGWKIQSLEIIILYIGRVNSPH